MSQVYSILLGVKFIDEEGAKNALQRKIASDTDNRRANYSLDHYRKDLGLDLDNVHDLVRMIFGGWDAKFYDVKWNGSQCHSSGFNASYGWESVMMESFEDLAPYMQAGSFLNIDVDEGVDYAVVKDGKAVWLR